MQPSSSVLVLDSDMGIIFNFTSNLCNEQVLFILLFITYGYKNYLLDHRKQFKHSGTLR